MAKDSNTKEDLLAHAHREVDGLEEEDREQLERWLHALDLDDLYVELARQALGAGALGEDASGNGRQLFERLLPRIRGPLCGNAALRALVDDDKADGIALAAIVASLVAGVIGAARERFSWCGRLGRTSRASQALCRSVERLTARAHCQRLGVRCGFPADAYGSAPGRPSSASTIKPPRRPRSSSAIDWLYEHIEEFREFLSDHDYRWVFEPRAYGAGNEAYLQMRVLQQLSALYRIYKGVGMRLPPMGDVVVRGSLTSRYDMMSPRYLPRQGIHFIVVPIGFADWSQLAWWAVYCWCAGGDATDVDPWLAVTSRRHSSGVPAPEAEPSPALLELIARHFADPAKDLEVDRTDAAAALVFFHTARLQSILKAAVESKLGSEVPGACDARDGEQEQRARRWLETAVAWIQSLEGTSAAMSTETRGRIEAFAGNLTGFGEHVVAVVQKIPDDEIARISSIVGGLTK
jgi:hypothetical protein